MATKKQLFELQSLLKSASDELHELLYLTSDIVKPLLSIAEARLIITNLLLDEVTKEPKSSHDLTDI